MPLGPANVIWASSPGACRFSFENVYSGPDPGRTTFTISVPVLPTASPNTALFILISATNGRVQGGCYDVGYLDALSVAHNADFEFDGSPNGAIGAAYGNSGLATLGGFRLCGFADVGTAGGTLYFDVGTYFLNLTSGAVIRSGNGVAIACAVDVGVGGVLTYAGIGPGGMPLDAVPDINGADSASPNVSVVDALGLGVLIAGVGVVDLFTPLPSASSPGWTDIVSDAQPATQAGGYGLPWYPSSVTLSVYDPATVPRDPTCSWSIPGVKTWLASAGNLWTPTGTRRGRSFGSVV